MRHVPKRRLESIWRTLQIAGIENIVVVQNKVDIVSKERAIESYQEILSFIEGTIAEGLR